VFPWPLCLFGINSSLSPAPTPPPVLRAFVSRLRPCCRVGCHTAPHHRVTARPTGSLPDPALRSLLQPQGYLPCISRGWGVERSNSCLSWTWTPPTRGPFWTQQAPDPRLPSTRDQRNDLVRTKVVVELAWDKMAWPAISVHRISTKLATLAPGSEGALLLPASQPASLLPTCCRARCI
jgi:hypothetical protein